MRHYLNRIQEPGVRTQKAHSKLSIWSRTTSDWYFHPLIDSEF